MSNDIEKQKTFQERMFERVRDSIGELMTDEELKILVDAAVKKAFFEPVKVQIGYNTVEKPPVFIEKIRDLINSKVDQMLREWMETHSEEVSKAITEAVEKGVYGMMVSHFEARAYGPLQEFAQQLRNKGLI